MGSTIIKLKSKTDEYYLEWSSVIDAPISIGMTLSEFKKYYINKYGTSEKIELEKRLERVEKNGTSSQLESLRNILSVNRAGKNETYLSKKKIIQHYCIDKNCWREYD